MKRIQTEVLVIGGGATGSGVVRDLAMRGFQTVLAERGDLTHGTSGRYHGLLHSGARYVVTDPAAARECIQENRILRCILAPCIEDTGGYFVLTEHDDPHYVEVFLSACQNLKIPTEEISIPEMLKAEPALNPHITRCWRVPDASADSFLAADLNAESARLNGAKILRYHQVEDLIVLNNRVEGAHCCNLVTGEDVWIHADLVINAAGAWAGRIAAMAGLVVEIVPSKGTMLALSHRIVNTVINRCKLPGDGDILVPTHTVAVIGTTNFAISDPDNFSIEPWEIDLLLTEGEKIVPGFSRMRFLRAWAGVRPLYKSAENEVAFSKSRAFVLLDHETQSEITGMLTISGGKWTTYRKMAEKVVDLTCQKLMTNRPCCTHLEALPNPKKLSGKIHHLGGVPSAKLAEIERGKMYGSLICECELATEAEVSNTIIEHDAQTIDDIRRDVRLGMGPCQGTFCAYRAAGLLHRLRAPSIEQTNLALRDFLQERWKGLKPILWEQQLLQERLTETIYKNNLNTDQLPGPESGRLSPKLYLSPSLSIVPQSSHLSIGKLNQSLPTGREIDQHRSPEGKSSQILDVLVIGAGIAGLCSALSAAKRGHKVRLISAGWGSLFWLPGCIDVLGYNPQEGGKIIDSPKEALIPIFQDQPIHPYTRVGAIKLNQALVDLQQVCEAAGYPLHGSLDQNWLLPSGLGSARPTCLAPETMLAGDLHSSDPILVVGFSGYNDFYPEWIAANLSACGNPAQGTMVDLSELIPYKNIIVRTLADAFEDLSFVESFCKCLKSTLSTKKMGSFKRLGLPAVLGYRSAIKIHRTLQENLDLPVFEIPCLPPSVPGIRLHQILVQAIENLGGEVRVGSKAVRSEIGSKIPITVWSEAAARQVEHPARACILATGGILGGGLIARSDGKVEEPIFNLPVSAPAHRNNWFEDDFLSPIGHPIYRAGIWTDDNFHPIDPRGRLLSESLYAVGSLLAGGDPIQTRSLEGSALLSGWWVGSRI